jgi:catechol 2,3-dioxygenase-like lactoylglutathione lyase family enzyme
LIDHITIRVANLQQSKSFYEKAFEPLGYKISFGEEGVFWAFDIGSGCLFEIAQFTGKSPLTNVHIAFRVDHSDKVHEFYLAALEAGGKDNGKPGPRPNYTKNYYACFVLDPDGHNIEAVFDVRP